MIIRASIRRLRFGAPKKWMPDRMIYARRHRVVIYTPDETAMKEGAERVQQFIRTMGGDCLDG